MDSETKVDSSAGLTALLRERLKAAPRAVIYQVHGEDERPLFDFPGRLAGRINWSPNSANIVRSAAERLGFIQVSTEFYPSTNSQELARKGVKVDDHRHISWRGWFSEITKRRLLLPDTNIILKRTLTSVIIPQLAGAQLKGPNLPFEIAIPRLAILELENLANRAHQSETASKGECFMAFNEIRVLKEQWSAKLTVPLTIKELERFNLVAGKRMTDAFIRYEVKKFGNAIFLTRDMVSALAANSEDLDAIYMAPKYPEEMWLDSVGIEEMGEMITEVATDCSEVFLRQNKRPIFKIEGVWSGKNWFDYYKRRVRVTAQH